MGVTHAHRASDAEAELRVQELRDAIRDLPVEHQQEVLEELARVAVEYESHGKVDPLLHFITSLLMTARLHRNPRYQKALAEADGESSDAGSPVDIGQWLADRGASRSSR